MDSPPAAPRLTVSARNFDRQARRFFLVLFLLIGVGVIYNLFEGGMLAGERRGMTDIGQAPTVSGAEEVKDADGQSYFPPPANAEPSHDIYAEILCEMRESSLWAARQKPGFEAYRFTYERSFHPRVCIYAWKDGSTMRIRSTVLETSYTEMPHGMMVVEDGRLYRKERSLGGSAWAKLQATFRDPGVRRLPPDDRTILDGSMWLMEWVVDSQYGRSDAQSPDWSSDAAALKPFIDAGLQMLKTARVNVVPIF